MSSEMGMSWRKVLEFSDRETPPFDLVYTRFRKLMRAALDENAERELVEAYEAARKELGARPTR
jgi:hypothetical protein